MKILSLFSFIVLTILLAFSCVQPPDYPEEPVITFKQLNKNVIPQGRAAMNSDTLLVTFSYTDGDGDLGNEDNLFDVFLIDSRDGAKTQFRLPVVPDLGSGNGISGEINLKMPNLFNMCCIFDDKNNQDPCTASFDFPTDTLSYSIYIQDRAGNESNRIETEPIVLLCN